ncbi:1318_t:CDS:2, partial [Racocetra fulgida]
EKKEPTNNTTDGKNSAEEYKFSTSGIANTVQTSMDEVKSSLKVVMNEVAALASSMENLNLQASKSA